MSPPASTPPSADATRGESLPITLFAVRVLLANKAREAVRRFDGTGMRDPGREVGLSGAGGGLGAGPTPSTHAVRREQAEAVLAAMSRLPAEYSDAIRRRAWDGATFADIGAATGRTEDAVRAGTQAAGARTRSGRRRYLGLNGGAAAEAPQGA